MRIFLLTIIFSGLFFGFGRKMHSRNCAAPVTDTLTATDSILHFWLNKAGVDDEKPIARTFYFWTTPEELDSVNAQHALLRSVCLPGEFFRNFYLDYRAALENKKWDKNYLAIDFRGGQFGRMRAAWTSYWFQHISETSALPATQLVKVELEDSALIVVFRPQEKKAWEVFDLRGNLVSQPEAEKRKAQIAVIYFSDHVNRKIKSDTHGTETTEILNNYERTFFLCNEKMIKSWQHGVPGMQHQILEDLNYLLLLDAYFASDVSKTAAPGKNGKNVMHCWKGETDHFSVAQFYFRTQLFASSSTPEAFLSRWTISSARYGTAGRNKLIQWKNFLHAKSNKNLFNDSKIQSLNR
jgi:hypothetical protein